MLFKKNISPSSKPAKKRQRIQADCTDDLHKLAIYLSSLKS